MKLANPHCRRGALHGVASADDVLQEIIAAALRSAGTFRYEGPDSPRRWIRGLAQKLVVHMVRDALRNKRRGKRACAPQPPPDAALRVLNREVFSHCDTPSRRAAMAESISALRAAVDSLPIGQRNAIIWHYMERRSSKYIAELTGKSESAVHGLLNRGLRALREKLILPAAAAAPS